jgi:hypothetical protein
MNALTESNYYRLLRCGRTARPLFRRLTPGTLAFLMFITLPFIAATQGKDAEARSGRDESNDGYLRVFSATDEFDDGGTSYYAHSSYVVYNSSGKLFKKIENHISPSDETPDLVALPAGNYTIEARSESRGYVRVKVMVRPGRLTILDLDSEQLQSSARFVAKLQPQSSGEGRLTLPS